jgi:hypothetical protein
MRFDQPAPFSGMQGTTRERVAYPRNSHRISRFLLRRRLEAIQLKAVKPL